MTAGDHSQHPRVAALLDCFREVDANMRDLPIYNGKIAIEAIGFRPFGDDALIGVVLTPWFMNLKLLPIAHEPMRMAEIGRLVEVELPAGSSISTACPICAICIGSGAIGISTRFMNQGVSTTPSRASPPNGRKPIASIATLSL